MISDTATLTTLVWIVGFSLTLWAGVTNRFRLRPYGPPRPLRAILGNSLVATLCTLFWFVYVPGWFVYRAVARRRARARDRTDR